MLLWTPALLPPIPYTPQAAPPTVALLPYTPSTPQGWSNPPPPSLLAVVPQHRPLDAALVPQHTVLPYNARRGHGGFIPNEGACRHDVVVLAGLEPRQVQSYAAVRYLGGG